MRSILAADVERRDATTIVLRITRAGSGGAVTVRRATDPAAAAGAPPVAHAAAGDDEVVLTGEPAGERAYFHLCAGGGPGLVVAERLLPLEGTLNFRDLGGYPAHDGRRVRWGRVFRSDHLALLTDADVATLRGLGIRVVHDLRRSTERARDPSRLPAGVTSIVHPIGEREHEIEQADLVEQVLAGRITAVSVDTVARAYVGMCLEHADTFGGLLTRLADDDGLPALFHCTAGKDRTGIAAALLLAILGVPDDVILDDYELSTRYRTARRLAELTPRLAAVGVDVDAVRPLFAAHREVLAGTLAQLAADHTSLARYIEQRAGVGAAVASRLRERLLE